MATLFRCVICNTVDLMDIAYPYGAQFDLKNNPRPLRCTVHQGHPWHNRFPREMYDPQIHDVINPILPRDTIRVILDD